MILKIYFNEMTVGFDVKNESVANALIQRIKARGFWCSLPPDPCRLFVLPRAITKFEKVNDD